MVMVGPEGAIELINQEAERVFGYSREEGRSLSVEMLMPERYRHGHAGMRAGFNEASEVRAMGAGRELFARRKDGTEFPVEVGLAPVELDGEKKVLCTVIDITERQRMQRELARRTVELEEVNGRLRHSEQQLQAANRELSDFATIVSHDLRTPLRGVAILAAWIQADSSEKLDEAGRENLREMIGRIARMDRMIEGILHYSRIGREQEKVEPVALAELVPVVVRDLAPPAHVQVSVAPGLPVVNGDPVQLRQVFQNLIGNAVHFGDKPQVEIRVEYAARGPFWEFQVTDNGPGIEEQDIERVFEMFQTVAPRDRTGSTGVGLALVRRMVERSGGRVWAESSPGGGSTFFFTWPKIITSPCE